MGSEWSFAPMPASIAVPAGRDDVGFYVTTAILPCQQMFRSALIVVRGLKSSIQFGRGREPHLSSAVVALPVLSMECDGAKGFKAGHKGSEEIKR